MSTSPEARAGARARGRVALRSLLPLALMAAIFFASARPMPASVPGQFDKLAHLVVFGVLAGAWVFALAPSALPLRRRIVLAVLVSILWGVSDELHQATVPGRHASVADALADAAGALLAGVAAATASRAGRRLGPASSEPRGERRGGAPCAPR